MTDKTQKPLDNASAPTGDTSLLKHSDGSIIRGGAAADVIVDNQDIYRPSQAGNEILDQVTGVGPYSVYDVYSKSEQFEYNVNSALKSYLDKYGVDPNMGMVTSLVDEDLAKNVMDQVSTKQRSIKLSGDISKQLRRSGFGTGFVMEEEVVARMAEVLKMASTEEGRKSIAKSNLLGFGKATAINKFDVAINYDSLMIDGKEQLSRAKSLTYTFTGQRAVQTDKKGKVLKWAPFSQSMEFQLPNEKGFIETVAFKPILEHEVEVLPGKVGTRASEVLAAAKFVGDYGGKMNSVIRHNKGPLEVVPITKVFGNKKSVMAAFEEVGITNAEQLSQLFNFITPGKRRDRATGYAGSKFTRILDDKMMGIEANSFFSQVQENALATEYHQRFKGVYYALRDSGAINIERGRSLDIGRLGGGPQERGIIQYNRRISGMNPSYFQLPGDVLALSPEKTSKVIRADVAFTQETLQRMSTGVRFYKGKSNVIGLRSAVFSQNELRGAINAINANTEALSAALDLNVRRIAYTPYDDITYLEDSFLKTAKKNIYKTHEVAFDQELGVNKRIFSFMSELSNVVEREKGIGSGDVFRNMYSYMMDRNVSMMTAANDILRMSGFSQTEVSTVISKLREKNLVIPTGSQKEIIGFSLKDRKLIETGNLTTIQDVTFGGFTRKGKMIRSAKISIAEEVPVGKYVKMQGEQKAVVGGVGHGFGEYLAGIAHIVREQGSFNPKSGEDMTKLIEVTEKYYRGVVNVASVGAEKSVGGLYEKGFSSAEKKTIASEVTDLVSTIATNKKLAIEQMKKMTPEERIAMFDALDKLGYSMKFETSQLGEATFNIYAEGGRNQIRKQGEVLKKITSKIPGFSNSGKGMWSIGMSDPNMPSVKRALEEAGFVSKTGKEGNRVYFKSPVFEASRRGTFIDVPFLERETNVLAEKYMMTDSVGRAGAVEMAKTKLATQAEQMLEEQSKTIEKLYSLFDGAFGRATTMSMGLVSEEEALGKIISKRPMSPTNIYNLYLKGLLPEAQKKAIEDTVSGKPVGKLKKSYDLLEAMFRPERGDSIGLADITELLKRKAKDNGDFSKITRLLTDTVEGVDSAVKQIRKAGGKNIGDIFVSRYGIGDPKTASFENVLKFIDEVLFSENIKTRKFALETFFPGKNRLAIPMMNAANEIDLAGKQSALGLRSFPSVSRFGSTSKQILGMDAAKKVVAIPIDTGGTIFPSSLYNAALGSFEGNKEKLDVIAKEAAIAAYGYTKNKAGEYIEIRSVAKAKKAGTTTAPKTVTSLVSYLSRGLGSSTVDVTDKSFRLPAISIQTLAAPTSYGKVPEIYKGLKREELPVYQQTSVFFNEQKMLKALDMNYNLERGNIMKQIKAGTIEEAVGEGMLKQIEAEAASSAESFIKGEGLDMVVERGPGISEARAAISKVFSAEAWGTELSDTARLSYFIPTEDDKVAKKAVMYSEQLMNLQNADFDGDNVRILMLNEGEARRKLKIQAEEAYGMHRKLASMFIDEKTEAREVNSLSDLVSKIADYDGKAGTLSAEEMAARRVNALEFAIKKSTEGGRKAVAELLGDDVKQIQRIGTRTKQATIEEIEGKGYKGMMQNLANYVTSATSVAAIKDDGTRQKLAKIVSEFTGIKEAEVTTEHITKTLRTFNELTVEQLANIKNVGRPEVIYEQLKYMNLRGPMTEETAKGIGNVYASVMSEAIGVLSESNKGYQADVGSMALKMSALMQDDMFGMVKASGTIDMTGEQTDILRFFGFSARRKEGTGAFLTNGRQETEDILIAAGRDDKSLLYTDQMNEMFDRVNQGMKTTAPEETIEFTKQTAYKSTNVQAMFANMSESEVADPAIKEAIRQAKANKESRMFSIVTEEGVGKMESKFVSSMQETMGKYGGRSVGIGIGIGAGIFAAGAVIASVMNNSSSDTINPSDSYTSHRSDSAGIMDSVSPSNPTMLRESPALINRHRVPNRNVVFDSFKNSPQYDIMSGVANGSNVVINNMMPQSYEVNDYTGEEYR